MVVVEVRGNTYYMNPKLKANWDAIKDGKLAIADDDRAYAVDGRERSGKSLFAIQQAAYIDPTLLDDAPDGTILPRITFSAEETLKTIRETKSTPTHTRAIVFDEAFRGLSSKSALSKVNKFIVQALQEMGQNNLVLFLVTPSFFMLELYAACHRTRTLFHIVKSKKNKERRMFRVYNEKKKSLLYRMGMKKGHSYCVPTRFKDWFFGKYPGGAEFEKRYRLKKQMSLTQPVEVTPQDKRTERYANDRNKYIRSWIHHSKLSVKEFNKVLRGYGHEMTEDNIRKIMREGTEQAEK
jgi:hypothetical protein